MISLMQQVGLWCRTQRRLVRRRAGQWALALLFIACFCIPAEPARAQQVLVCYTLHNDLANFDRRARQVDHYFRPALRRQVGSPNLRGAYARSHLGGSDVVRLRIIAEMRRFGCPISSADTALLEDYYHKSYGRKVFLPIHK